MIFFSNDAQKSIDELLYYPYTLGRQLEKAVNDMRNIIYILETLPMNIRTTRTVRIPNIGTIRYGATSKNHFISSIKWSATLKRFYYRKSNFITITTAANIPSVHPSFYTERVEPSFKCTNDFKVVSRKITNKGELTEVFNFMNPDGKIICDIDFTQAKPFVYRAGEGITARGYTPNGRGYRIYDDGIREEVNESRNVRLKSLIKESVDRCFRKYIDEMC